MKKGEKKQKKTNTFRLHAELKPGDEREMVKEALKIKKEAKHNIFIGDIYAAFLKYGYKNIEYVKKELGV